MPGRLTINDLILTEGPSYAPVGQSVKDASWFALTNDVVGVSVLPGPYWVTNSPTATADLFEWWINGQLTQPDYTGVAKWIMPSVGTNDIVVLSHSAGFPNSQNTTLKGVAVTASPHDELEVFLNSKDYIEFTVEPAEAAPYVRLTVQPDEQNHILATFTDGNTSHFFTSAQEDVEVFGANVFNYTSGNSTGQAVITMTLVTPNVGAALVDPKAQTQTEQTGASNSQASECPIVKVFVWSLEKLQAKVMSVFSEENLRKESTDLILSKIEPSYQGYIAEMYNSGDPQLIGHADAVTAFIESGGLKLAIRQNFVNPLLDFIKSGYDTSDKTPIDATPLISLGHIKGHSPEKLGASAIEWDPIIRFGGLQDFVNYAQGDLENINLVIRNVGLRVSKNLPLWGDLQPSVSISGTTTLGTVKLSLDPEDTTQDYDLDFKLHSTRGTPKSFRAYLGVTSNDGKLGVNVGAALSVDW